MDSGTQNPKKMSRSLLLLSRSKNSRSYSLNNQPIKIETITQMLVTQGLAIVATHVNQLLWNLANIGLKKITGALFTGANVMNTVLQLTTKINSKCNTIPQQIRPKSPNCQTKKRWRSIWHILKVKTWLMEFLVWPHLWRQIITLHWMKLTESLMETQYIVLRSNILPLMFLNS